MKIASTIAATLYGGLLLGQLPVTDLYQVRYSMSSDKAIVRQVTYLSDYNREGYNNQPSFIGVDKLYSTTDKYGGQTEIVELDMNTAQVRRITRSEESDYSPQLHPNGRSISTVRVEQDQTTQTLTLYSMQSSRTKRLLPEIGDIGYYHWLSDEEVVLFRLPEPFRMTIANIRTGDYADVLEGIGRCFRSDGEGLLYFIHKLSDTDWYIKRYDPLTGRAETITKALEGSEDFEVLVNGAILMAKGSVIYQYQQGDQDQWMPIMDLAAYGINDISRLAASRGKVVLVNTK